MIQIKGEQGESILLEINGRKYPVSSNEWDIDFLKASVRAAANGFTAHFNFLTRRTEILYLIEKLQSLSLFKERKINFNTIEDNLLLDLHVNDLGKIIWKIELQYPDSYSTKLIIHLENEIGSINVLIKELEEALDNPQ